MRVLTPILAFALSLLPNTTALDLRGARPHNLIKDDPTKRALLQNVVTWDNYSLMINGERQMIFSGEYHPFRLPVPSLWIDVFQKIKALGLNTASFYVHWAQLEGKPGTFSAEGIFDYAKFFDAAKEVGVWLTARPGPYINAEASGGGFPGWLQRIKGHLRTADADYLAATDNYIANIAGLIAKAQITNGGPIILYQPENEYSGATSDVKFPDPAYMQYVEDQARKAGVVIPFISNDAWTGGHNAPGTGEGEVDIYGHDGYPLGFDCGNPTHWPAGNLPTYYRSTHLAQSPTTPYTIPEFQGGSFDPWGGPGFPKCEELLSQEQVRVFYKNNYAAGVTLMSLYMIFGGTNWGNLGHPGGYTSYDYASVIAEDRTVAREKYSELKLQAHFLKVSPGYLVASAGTSNLTGTYSSNTDVTITPIIGNNGSFYVVRHTDYTSTSTTLYNLTLSTSLGTFNIPQTGGSLTLSRRDSKIHVTDYPVGDATLVYSTAEIFTWQKYADKTVLVIYGGAGEKHELLVQAPGAEGATASTGVTLTKGASESTAFISWETNTSRGKVQIGNLVIYCVDRNAAYNYWATDLAGHSPLIVNGGYLVRSASIHGNTLTLKADFNTTGTVEIIGIPSGVTSLIVNSANTRYTVNGDGNWVFNSGYTTPTISLPDLTKLDWHYINSLPEVKAGYDDTLWPAADHTTTNNTFAQPFLTDVSLYGSDYGFHAGALLFRGHFVAAGSESSLYLSTQGGTAFGASVWLNGTSIGSWAGDADNSAHNDTFTLPSITAGQAYVITVLIDNMGLDEDWTVGTDEMKLARGMLDYRLTTASGSTTPITWKITGNLGGESYADQVRGPLNEGGLFIERQGYHQPSPPLSKFSPGGPFSSSSSALSSLAGPSVTFFTAKLPLNLPSDKYDTPLRFVFASNTSTTTSPVNGGTGYRAWLYVNGFQFGRYVSYIGPQSEFPVPEGILNYNGDNWIGLVVWAPGQAGAQVPGLSLVAKTPVLTGREEVRVVGAPEWRERAGAY